MCEMGVKKDILMFCSKKTTENKNKQGWQHHWKRRWIYETWGKINIINYMILNKKNMI